MKNETPGATTILVVDDQPEDLRMLLQHLQHAGLHTLVARNGEGALRQVARARPDLILLDVLMPGLDGFETCRRLKQDHTTQDITVIFLTGLAESVDKIQGLHAGGADYVTKPFNSQELLARVKTHLELRRYQEMLRRRNQELQQANRALLELRQELEHVTRIDALTRLPNRRSILEQFDYEKIRFERHQAPFVLMLCDIDQFKEFNDRLGQDCGDFILRSIATLFRASIRKQDHLGRWGGEEFLFLLPETNGPGGRVLAEKLSEELRAHSFVFQEHTLRVTASFGLQVFENYDMGSDECLKKASQAVEQAKQAGGDTVRLFENDRKR
jgi:diguanylate cyclase (GGDEF)-like protein